MRIAIGNDHAGYKMKIVVCNWLEEQGYQFKNFGTNSPFSADYPDFVHPVAGAIEDSGFDMGILICGSGLDISCTANKYQGINAALCWCKEISQYEREHNNANILCLPGIFLSDIAVAGILKSFLETPFTEGRHQTKSDKVSLESCKN